MTRKIIGLVTCLVLLAVCARAEAFVVNYTGSSESTYYALLISDDGTPLTPPNTYRSIYAITPDGTPEADRLYAAETYSFLDSEAAEAIRPSLYDSEDEDIYYRIAMLDGAGRRVTEFDYISLKYCAPDRVVFTQPDNMCGVMDARGNVLMPAAYADIQPAGDGGFLALDPEGGEADYATSYPILFVDAEGNARDTGLHAYMGGLGMYDGGIAAIAGVEDYGGQCVYVDDRGEVLFGRSFEYAEGFRGCLASVTVNGRYGLIDRSGDFVLEPEQDYIEYGESLDGDIFIAIQGGSLNVYDAGDGTLRFGENFDADSLDAMLQNPGVLEIMADGVSGLYSTTTGEQLAALPRDRDISCWFSALCDGVPERLVESFGDWPLDGAHLLDMALNQVSDDFQGLSGLVWQDGRGLYLTQSYRVYRDQDGDYAANWHSWRYGLCDQDGVALLDCIYESILPLSDDRFWVQCGNRTGLIDLEGNWYYVIDDYMELMD